MWFRKIKRKKLQFFLVGLILAVTSAIFAGCLIFVVESGRIGSSYYSREKNADAYAFVTNEKAKETLIKKAKEDPKISDIQSVDVLCVNEIYKLKGKKQSVFNVELFRTINYKDFPFQTDIVEGKKQDHPGEGEIWVTRLYADQNDVKIGDPVTIKDKKLKISGLINCAISPSSLMSVTPFFVNDTTYQQLKTTKTYQPLVLVKASDTAYGLKFITSSIGGKTNNIGFSFNLDALKICITLLSSVFGGIGILAALIIFAVSILIIRFLIKSMLLKEFKAIGIHKALGDNSKLIRGVYMKAYLVVGMIGITIGSIFGIPISYQLGSPQFRYIEEFHLSFASIGIIAMTILLLLILLAINVWKSLKKIDSITPVETLHIGMVSSKKKIKRSLIPNASSSFSTAINDLVKHRVNSLMMIIMMSISIFLSFMFVNIEYSCSKISDYRNLWVSFPRMDATLTGNINDELISEMKDNDMVKRCMNGSIKQGLKMEKGDRNCRFDFSNVSSIIYEDWDKSITGIPLTSGRVPKNQDEVLVSDKLLSKYNYQTGDYVCLKINGRKHTFLITGSINTMMNEGQDFGFNSKVYKLIDPSEVHYDYAFVDLKKGVSYSEFKKFMNKNHDKVNVEKVVPEIRTSCESVCDVAKPISIVLVFVFIIFSIINIVNLLAMDYINNRRQYGILKSLGFTNGYICRKCFYKTGTLLAIATTVGYVLYVLLAAKTFRISSGIDGLVTYVPYTLGILGVLVVIVFLVTLLFCLPIKKIVPTELMEE